MQEKKDMSHSPKQLSYSLAVLKDSFNTHQQIFSRKGRHSEALPEVLRSSVSDQVCHGQLTSTLHSLRDKFEVKNLAAAKDPESTIKAIHVLWMEEVHI